MSVENLKHTQNRTKDPDSIRWYTLDWSRWLAGDQIQSSVWTIPAGLASVDQQQTPTSTRVKLSGGTLGEQYTITNTITTVQGETEDCSLYLRIVHK